MQAGSKRGLTPLLLPRKKREEQRDRSMVPCFAAFRTGSMPNLPAGTHHPAERRENLAGQPFQKDSDENLPDRHRHEITPGKGDDLVNSDAGEYCPDDGKQDHNQKGF